MSNRGNFDWLGAGRSFRIDGRIVTECSGIYSPRIGDIALLYLTDDGVWVYVSRHVKPRLRHVRSDTAMRLLEYAEREDPSMVSDRHRGILGAWRARMAAERALSTA